MPRYDFRFAPLAGDLDIRIDILREGKPAFVSRLWGAARPFNAAGLWRLVLRKPLDGLLTSSRLERRGVPNAMRGSVVFPR